MKIQFLNGGLANQAFQYIFARYYELSHPGEIMYLDDSYFALHTVHNGYELEKVFGIKPHFISECFDEDVWEHILNEKRNGKSVPQVLSENGMDIYMFSEVGDGYKSFNPFHGNVVPIPTNIYEPKIQETLGNVYYHGYWINKNWFGRYKNEFLKEFTFPEIEDQKNKNYQNEILNTLSVCIHVRRGDYVGIGQAMEPAEYRTYVEIFVKALRMGPDLEQNIKRWNIIVFSDDIEWCKRNREAMGLSVFGNIIFVEGNVEGKNYIDLQLMSMCEGIILSKSAFSYLAALLNRRKKIIANPTTREI